MERSGAALRPRRVVDYGGVIALGKPLRVIASLGPKQRHRIRGCEQKERAVTIASSARCKVEGLVHDACANWRILTYEKCIERSCAASAGARGTRRTTIASRDAHLHSRRRLNEPDGTEAT